MATNSKRGWLVQYGWGLAVAALLIGVTIARADGSACSQCQAYYAWEATQPNGGCYGNPNKNCVQPYINSKCGSICADDYTLPDGNVTCTGEATAQEVDCGNNINGPCTFDVWHKQCDTSGTVCNEYAVSNSAGKASICYVQCICQGTP